MTRVSFSQQNPRFRIGFDIVSISRIDGLLQDYPQRFRERVFTPEEKQYCESRVYPAQHYAARWAVKEAYIKAVNPDSQIHYRDIELSRIDGADLVVTGSAYDTLSNNLNNNNYELDSDFDNIHIDVSAAHSIETDTAGAIVAVSFI